jgi:hypothetical protein
MLEHFLKENNAENRIRHLIYELMTHFEEMYDLLGEMLSFKINEEETKDAFEKHFIDMEKLHRDLGKELAPLREHTNFEENPLYEAVRRTYNHLKALNVIDLDKKNWAKVVSMALPDKIYYRQIKAMVF